MTAPPGQPGNPDNERADLDRLAAGLTARGYRTRLVVRPGQRVYLQVWNPEAEVMTERIYAEGDFFVWSWHQPVARRDRIADAVDFIDRVLRSRKP